ncbi:tetratricopeptide repeat protein [Tropicimonas sp.]|uniref:tetratricopeptide repeat protein n=1 Tax=Tropicimonas sp. TaxID=2067044 RepID=UPI003A843583
MTTLVLMLAPPLYAQTATAPAPQPTARIPAYVGSETCATCHAPETAEWTGSHHDLAWTEPTADNILGDFNGAAFTHRGVTTTFSRDGDRFFIESDGPDGASTPWPVAGVIGITPLQQYFVETVPGRFQSFDIPWDTTRHEWYHMYPDEHLPATDAFHWTGPYKTWNSRCAECHATDYVRNYQPETNTYASTYSEIGVGCEACHGPGEAHLTWAENERRPENWPWDGLSEYGFTVVYRAGDTETGIQQCAGCHSRRGPLLGGSPVPGTPYHAAYRLSTLREPLYHPDGQIRDEVYVYGSFLQSKMYEKGVACSDCHNVHAGAPDNEGNDICTTCHSPAGNPRFPSLRLAAYDSPEHHFHQQGSEGAQCASCHMIERTYMGVDGRRDHSFRVPRPDLSIATGAPNTCTDCHAEEGPYWAQAELEKRFPDSQYRGPHFATAFHAARQGDPVAADGLAGIALSDLPGIVRATALELLQPMATPELAVRLAPLLEDADPMVRANAAPLQRSAAPQDMVQNLLPLLEDPMLLVRQAAAREMLSAPVASLPDRWATAQKTATAEWQETLGATADFPETQLALGGIALTTRNVDGAIAAFRQAVELDPQMVQAWSMIVRLEAATGDEDAARETLADALARNPDDPGLQNLELQLR